MRKFAIKTIYRLLRSDAIRLIKRHRPFVIAITGSVGKTSTKEAVYRVLNDQYGEGVRKNYGNLNAEIGVPLTILGYEKLPPKLLWPFFLIGAGFRSYFISKYPRYLIIEMGVEKPGDIKYLTEIAKPDITIITALSGAHLENFSDREEYQKEKLSTMGLMKKGGSVFVNGDDPDLSKLTGVKKIGIENKNVDYQAEITKLGLEGVEFRISCTGHKISIKSKLLGTQLVYASLFGFAIGHQFGISLLKVGRSIESIEPIAGRMRLIAGKNNINILDDTYNGSPSSVEYALRFLSEVKYDGRKVAILGTMNELGQYSESAHKEIGRYARGKCDLAVFVGKYAEVSAGEFGTTNSIILKNRKELLDQATKIVKLGDLVLVKASQNNNYFEEVVKLLMKNPEDAPKLLVRQNSFWLTKKK